jgi:hypothetical protein
MPEDSWLNARHVWLVVAMLAFGALPTAHAQQDICFPQVYKSTTNTYNLNSQSILLADLNYVVEDGPCCFTFTVTNPNGNQQPGVLVCNTFSVPVVINRQTKDGGQNPTVRRTRTPHEI